MGKEQDGFVSVETSQGRRLGEEGPGHALTAPAARRSGAPALSGSARSAYHGRVPGLSHARAYGALLLIVGLWGSYPALAKLALQDVPPVILVALRGVVASAFLVAMLARSGAGTVSEITPAALRRLRRAGPHRRGRLDAAHLPQPLLHHRHQCRAPPGGDARHGGARRARVSRRAPVAAAVDRCLAVDRRRPAHHHPGAAREPPAGPAPARRPDQPRLDGVLELLYRVRQAGLARRTRRRSRPRQPMSSAPSS